MTDDEIDNLLKDLQRPMFILKMAAYGKPYHSHTVANIGMAKSCATRAGKAREEVRQILEKAGLL